MNTVWHRWLTFAGNAAWNASPPSWRWRNVLNEPTCPPTHGWGTLRRDFQWPGQSCKIISPKWRSKSFQQQKTNMKTRCDMKLTFQCHMIVFLMFFLSIDVCIETFFSNQRKLFEVLSLDGIFFSSRWCGLVSAIWSRNSLQMDSWLVGYHARCVVVRQWYSVQPCTANKLVLPKTLSKWSSRKQTQQRVVGRRI